MEAEGMEAVKAIMDKFIHNRTLILFSCVAVGNLTAQGYSLLSLSLPLSPSVSSLSESSTAPLVHSSTLPIFSLFVLGAILSPMPCSEDCQAQAGFSNVVASFSSVLSEYSSDAKILTPALSALVNIFEEGVSRHCTPALPIFLWHSHSRFVSSSF